MKVGYVAAVDRLEPRAALEMAVLAEAGGFNGTVAADLFQPWLPSLGQAPAVWPFLAALAEHNQGDLGAGMATAGGRMHPAAIAQAAATIAAMNPGRLWLSLGAGEALHEHATGGYWPEPAERIDRLFEAVEVVRRLFAASAVGRETRYAGKHFTLENSRLWTVPPVAPAVMVATSGPVTARRAGRHADGLLAVGVNYDQAAIALERFRSGATEAGKDAEAAPAWLHLNVAWGPTDAAAQAEALERYPMGAMRFARGDLRSPQLIEQISRLVRADDLTGRLVMSADPQTHIDEISRHLALGYDRVFVHHVGVNQAAFINAYAADVLPAL